ncbi:MAG TPA: hypothetical protein VJL56_01645 [Candidatus Bathyarchaeia archaeon]|nr:hypothetical protein [Candidatus Bathyarchaeia archaeon]
MFCATVQDTSQLTNPVTGQPFFWARVRTLGCELDVVADPAIVKGTIKKNSIIGSMCRAVRSDPVVSSFNEDTLTFWPKLVPL